MDGRCKKKHQPLSDAAACYGIDILKLQRENYEAYFGIYMNLGRAELRQADTIRTGSLEALTQHHFGGFPADPFFIATAATPEEGLANAALAKARQPSATKV